MYAPLTRFETQTRSRRSELALLRASEADRLARRRERRFGLPRLPRLAGRAPAHPVPCV